jgi:hypothetical protein
MFMIRTSKASLQVDKEVFFERGFVSLKPPQNTGKTNASGTIVTVGGAGGTKATNEIRTYVRTYPKYRLINAKDMPRAVESTYVSPFRNFVLCV